MSACALWQKLALMPGCRPWDAAPVEVTIVQSQEAYGPFLPDQSQSSEFFGPAIDYTQRTVSKVAANVSRLFDSTKNAVAPQSDVPACAWYARLNPFSQCNTITKAATTGTAAVGDFLQSTILKVVVVVVIVAIIAVYGMAFFQAKGAKLASS